MITLEVNIATQFLSLFDKKVRIKDFPVSTAKNGPGEVLGSEQTPRGWHVIRAKIGKDAPINTVFVGRRPTGEIYTPELKEKFSGRDWILTRILWLSGTEIGKNRLGEVDTMSRYIYIHGSPDDVPMGVPGSRGCIRMHNHHLVELFDLVSTNTRLLIKES